MMNLVTPDSFFMQFTNGENSLCDFFFWAGVSFSHKIPFKQTWRRLKRQLRTPRTQADRHAPSLFTRARGPVPPRARGSIAGGAVARKRSAPCWRPHQGNGAKIAETAHGIKTSLAELRRVPNHLVSHRKPF